MEHYWNNIYRGSFPKLDFNCMHGNVLGCETDMTRKCSIKKCPYELIMNTEKKKNRAFASMKRKSFI